MKDEREAAGLVDRALAELFVEETYPGAKVLDVETKTEDKRLVEVVTKVNAGGRVFTLRLLGGLPGDSAVFPLLRRAGVYAVPQVVGKVGGERPAGYRHSNEETGGRGD